jgi:heme ABC exporter ATP-binding subunit CcmA
MIQVRGLVKSFGGHVVLRGLDLDVESGECLALVGPNGAGKTTLLRILAALSKPTAGSIRIAGSDLQEGTIPIRRQIGFLSHEPLLYGDLSAEENLHFYGRMYDVPDLGERISSLLRRVDLEPARYDLVRTFSRGMKQRLSIARALLHDPPVLLLDEPYTGLDRRSAIMLDAVLQEAGLSSRTVLLTTHNLERGLSMCRRVALLAKGEITYEMDERNWDLDRFQQVYEQRAAPKDGTPTGGQP